MTKIESRCYLTQDHLNNGEPNTDEKIKKIQSLALGWGSPPYWKRFSYLPPWYHAIAPTNRNGKSPDDYKRRSRNGYYGTDVKMWDFVNTLFRRPSNKQNREERTNVAPNGSYIFDVIRPQYWVYRSSEALYGYPDGKRASADVPELEHTFRHRQKNKYACREICNGDEGVSRIHVESLWVRTQIIRWLLYGYSSY